MKRLLLLAGLALLVSAMLVAILCTIGEPTQNGKPVSYWISQMGTWDASGKAIGETALDKMDPAKTVSYLVRTIGASDQTEPKWHWFYRKHYHQIPVFIRKKLANPDSGVPTDYIRGRAAYYLIDLGRKKVPSAKAAIPKLIALFDNSNESSRFFASLALTGFGKDATPAVPVIIKLLRADPGKINDPMLTVLQGCDGADAKAAIPALRDNLGGTNAFLRSECAKTLWSLDHSQADIVRPVAMALTTDQDAGVRIECATLLWCIDKNPKTVTPILIGLLNDDNHPYDYRTILLLKKIGSGAKEAMPSLSNWLNRNRNKKNGFVVKAANDALGAMGSQPPLSN